MTRETQLIRLALDAKTLHEVRQIGRAVGVKEPTAASKGELIDKIMAIAMGLAESVPRSTRGKPPKSSDYDAAMVDRINALRCQYLAQGAPQLPESGEGQGASSSQGEAAPANGGAVDESEYTGVLEYTEKFWFVRVRPLQVTPQEDVFVHISYINRFRLKEGDVVKVKAKRRGFGECPTVTYVAEVNGNPPDMARAKSFENLTSYYPERRMPLEREGCTLTDRVIDLFAPIGFGQRALIVSPPKAGKTSILRDIARSITQNHPHAKVIILLIDERPEEVTDMRLSVPEAKVVASTFDEGDESHTHAANLTLEYAKRLVEMGEDVVILLDSLTSLVRSCNATSVSPYILSSGLEPQSYALPKRFLGAAKNTEAGTLTVVATLLIETGSRLDEIIYDEFKSTGNMEIILKKSLAEKRVFPAMDVLQSGARREELLLTDKQLNATYAVRSALLNGLPYTDLLAAVKSTKTNAEFYERVWEFLKGYEGEE